MSSLINNALSGTLAAQASLNTTSQNIANLQTKGYTRQGVLLNSIAPAQGTTGAGFGVKVSGLLRYSDAYKTQQLWRANTDMAQYTQAQPYLTQLEQVMGDATAGLSVGIDNFFKALNAVGVDPTSTPLRGQVVHTAEALAQNINSIYQLTRTQQLSIVQQRESVVPQFNTLTATIATLNKRITEASSLGTNPSALIDERDRAIDSLSELAALEVIEQSDGTATVSLRTGQPLVVAGVAAKMVVATGSTLEINFGNNSFALDDTRMGGRLGGIGKMEKETLLPLQASLLDLAEQVTTMVNTQHAAGFTLGPPPVPGGDIFQFNGGGSGGIMSLVPGFTSTDLAFSSDGTPGDSGNLQLLVDLKNQTVTLDSVGTVILGDADTQLVGKLAVESKQNQALIKTSTTIRQQAEDDWASTSSVNKDEEAVNLVEFQNMYQANMKVLAVANNLFDATLAMFN
ncbi:flagellar hook-associated protein FlgK [Pseudoduganella rhizocola]|uniref:flagellar hook-associated protein FlgK n=1 Tax=Pseudoduganella rhizocola TaxID=3382643 RepID=UPI0038B4BD66